MSMQKFLVTSMIYLSLAGTGVAQAKNDKDEDEDKRRATTEVVERSSTRGNEKLNFTVREREVLKRYEARQQRVDDDGAAGKQRSLPPGLAKKVAEGKALPPGWQKKVQRGEVLGSDLYGAANPLPDDVRDQLPPDPEGTVTVEVGGEVVRVVEATREIIDIVD